MTEVWKEIPEYPDYRVSSLGRVKRVKESSKGNMPKVLKPWLTKDGYAIITLYRNGGSKRKQVSRLVCSAFHGDPPSDGHQAAHNNGNPKDNRAENLRWATRSENMKDCLIHGTRAMGKSHGRTTKPERTPRGENHGGSSLKESDVIEILKHPKTKGSGAALALKYGVSPVTICTIRSRKTWRHVNEPDT